MSTSTTKLPCLKYYDYAMYYLATNYLFPFPLFFLFITMTLVLTSQYGVHGSDTRFERMAQVSGMMSFTDFTSRFLGKNLD
ncbi:hypothetical protein V8C40DRAFT_241825, partial [Trichoderma camerunense]